MSATSTMSKIHPVEGLGYKWYFRILLIILCLLDFGYPSWIVSFHVFMTLAAPISSCSQFTPLAWYLMTGRVFVLMVWVLLLALSWLLSTCLTFWRYLILADLLHWSPHYGFRWPVGYQGDYSCPYVCYPSLQSWSASLSLSPCCHTHIIRMMNANVLL